MLNYFLKKLGVVFVFLIFPEVLLSQPIEKVIVDMEAPPFERGYYLGETVAKKYPEFELIYDQYLKDNISQHNFNVWSNKSIPFLEKNVPQELKDEWQGVIEAWNLSSVNKLGDGKLSIDEYKALNLLPDLGIGHRGSAFSVLGSYSSMQPSIIGQNIDVFSDKRLAGLYGITTFQSKHLQVASMGLLGLTGVTIGINSNGLFSSYINASDRTPYYSAHRVLDGSYPIAFFLREALQKSQSFKQALDNIRYQKVNYDSNFLIVDHNEGKVIEVARNGLRRLRSRGLDFQKSKSISDNKLLVLDCTWLIYPDQNCGKASEVTRWQRFLTLSNSKTSVSAKSVMNIMTDKANHGFEIFNKNTVFSLVYESSSSNVFLIKNTEDNPQYRPAALFTSDYKKSFFSGIKLELWLLLFILIFLYGFVLFKQKSESKV